MRWLEQVQSTALIVEWTASIVKWQYAMGASCADKHDLPGAIGLCQSIAGSFACFETVCTENISCEMHHRLVTVPQLGAKACSEIAIGM